MVFSQNFSFEFGPCGYKVEGDPDDVEDCEAVDVEDGGGEGGDEQAQGQQEVADDGQAGAVARPARLRRHQLQRVIQGDHSGCVKPPVDIRTKIVF